MITTAIMQPTFMPWSGYFNLIASADNFVFLDDVQFLKRSWQSRNRFLNNGKEHMLSLPTRKASQNTVIRDILLVDFLQCKKNHINFFTHSYKKAPFSVELIDLVNEIYGSKQSNLSEFNIFSIKTIAQRLELKNTKYLIASKLACDGKRSEHLDAICQKTGAKNYLSPAGSKEYLLEDDFENISGIRLKFQDFSPAIYEQTDNPAFISHLSILDVIAHLGFSDAARYCKGSL